MKHFALATLILFSGALMAAETITDSETTPTRTQVEIGATVGTPSGLNFNLGVWGIGSIPVVLRLGGMNLGHSLNGFQFEAGYLFDRTGDLQQYVSLGIMHTFLQTNNGQEHIGGNTFGPFYGIRWNGLFAQVGATFGTDQYIWLRPFSPALAVGYLFIL